MNSRYTMIDSAIRAWIGEIEDTNALREWARVIDERIKSVEEERKFTTDELVAGVRVAKRGDVLYAERRVRLNGELYPFVYFWKWQPRKRLLWVSPTKITPHWRGRVYPIDASALHFHQLARTELAVRRRAPMSRLPPPEPKTPKPSQSPLGFEYDPNDIPF